MLVLSLTVILPFLIVLAFKSEKKQAKLSHQLSEFKKDLVRTDFGSADPENNNKLLIGTKNGEILLMSLLEKRNGK